MNDDAAPPQIDELLEFIFRIGQAYLACGEQTATVELILRRIATAYGLRRSRVVAFPTALFISVHDGEHERVTLAEGPTQKLRLDQIASVYQLGDSAQDAALEPREGLSRLSSILRQPARFGALGIILGHTILTAGLAILLRAPLINLLAATLLGTLVGALKVFNRDRPILAVPLPVVAAGMVSALVFLLVDWKLPIDPLYVLVPPLVAFLPGAMLTLAMVELAYGDMVSGSSRLITGLVQLLLLAIGLAGGATLVGYSSENLIDATQPLTAWPLLQWLGVLIFGLGAYLHFSAPKRSLVWILLAVVVSFSTQQLASRAFGVQVSGFFGMLVATPLAYWIQLRMKGPPAMVTFLPSFWVLVPGTLALTSVKTMLSDREAGVEGLTNVMFALSSIALGSLLGASLYKGLSERFGSWQTQLGKVGRYFRTTRGK